MMLVATLALINLYNLPSMYKAINLLWNVK